MPNWGGNYACGISGCGSIGLESECADNLMVTEIY